MFTQNLFTILIVKLGVTLLADTPNWYAILLGLLFPSAIVLYLNILNKIDCNMKKFKHLRTTVQFGDGCSFRVTTLDESKKLRYWLISVDHSKVESEWLVKIFTVSYYGRFNEIRVLNTVHEERIVYERNSPSYVARLVFRHYLTWLSSPGPDDLPF